MQIAQMIRNSGNNIDVHAVATGEEAMCYFKEHSPHCSIVDYRLEVEDGLVILAEMKQLSPYHPVIMMTGQGNEELEMTDVLYSQKKLAKRAADLVNTLESYALLDAQVSFSSVSLKEAAEEAKDNINLHISKQQATVIVGQLPTVTGHHVQITQLFQNLIQNGLKYNENTQPTVTIKQEDNVTVVVSDNGIGIPEKHWITIFEPLKRLWGVDNKYEGTGIGLATCKKIVERHNGEIWCTSREGEGSQFYVRFQAS